MRCPVPSALTFSTAPADKIAECFLPEWGFLPASSAQTILEETSRELECLS